MKQKLEAILYAIEGPHSIKELASWLDASVEDTTNVIQDIQTEGKDRGVIVLTSGDEVSLAVHPDTKPLLEKIRSQEETKPLTKAGLETMTIIGFLAPVDRHTIDLIRGVQSHQALRHLLLRALITRDGSKYRLTTEALRHLGIESVDQLPEYKTVKANLEQRLGVLMAEPQTHEQTQSN